MDLHSTDYLLGVLEALDRPRGFLLDTFFPEEQIFDTEEVHFDKIDRARRLAPFVSPLVGGKAERQRGYQTRSFRPAYVKPKHVIEATTQLKRRAGESLTGSMSPGDRLGLAIADNLAIEDDQITRREEAMASELLRTGKIVVEGDDYPRAEVDFGRDASLTKALTSAARWGESGVSPYANIKSWAVEVAKKSGAHPGTVILDPLSSELLQKDEELRAVLDIRRQAGGEMQFLAQATGAQGEEAVFIGAVGQFEFWQYSALYTDADGTERNMMPDYSVVMGSKKLSGGIRLYGAILDIQAMEGLAMGSRYPKSWSENDPPVGYTMTQSSPLPCIRRPDATVSVTVR